jgi:hypothetical protein
VGAHLIEPVDQYIALADILRSSRLLLHLLLDLLDKTVEKSVSDEDAAIFRLVVERLEGAVGENLDNALRWPRARPSTPVTKEASTST